VHTGSQPERNREIHNKGFTKSSDNWSDGHRSFGLCSVIPAKLSEKVSFRKEILVANAH